MHPENPLMEQSFRQLNAARQAVEKLSSDVLAGSTPSTGDLVDGLKQLFGAVKDGASRVRSSALQPSDSTSNGRQDVLEIWDSLAEIHLPVSLALLTARFQSPDQDPVATASRPVYGRVGEEPTAADGDDPPVLLLMAGFSVEQLVLCIALHYVTGGVRRIVPFAGKLPGGGTSWSNQAREKILAGLQTLKIPVASRLAASPGEGLIIEPPESVQASNPARVFQEILKWSRREAHSRCRCALDVTGGQKPMDSGASYAAMYLGWPAYYLDFTDYDSQLRRPKPHSLQYARLQLPSSAFSADTRKQIVELFQRCRFGRAAQYVEQLAGFAAKSSFFDAQEREHIGQAARLIALSDAWLRADYFDDAIRASSDEVCQFFRDSYPAGPSVPPAAPAQQGAKRGLPESNLCRKLEEMMDLPNSQPERTPLLAYAVDEYWRIRSGHEAGQDYRECLVATHGLAEVLVDAVLRLQRFRLRIAKVLGAVMFLPQDEPPQVLDRDKVEQQLQDQDVPIHRLPPAAGGEKRKVLLTGAGTFGLRIPCEACEKQDDFDFASLPNWLCDSRQTTRDQPFIELVTQLTLDAFQGGPAVTGPSGQKESCKQRENNWGVHYWTELRNLTAHWRVPLGQDFEDILDRAMNQWLPRYIGLYALAVQGDRISSSCSEADCLRAGQSHLGDGQCRPWHDKLGELRDWLQVPC